MIGNEWKTRLSTCDLNDWKDLGEAVCNIRLAAWWPQTSSGVRKYELYSMLYVSYDIGVDFRNTHSINGIVLFYLFGLGLRVATSDTKNQSGDWRYGVRTSN